jgi:hypothetical protein
MASRTWRMVDKNGIWLGTLRVVGKDQPWWFCEVEPRPEFEAVRCHFEESIRRIEAPRSERIQDLQAFLNAVYKPIWELGIRLESTETAEYYARPMLQIRGRRAQLRGVADNWREVRHPGGG